MRRHNDIDTNGTGPSPWTCYDVIILYSVIDFYGSKIVLKFQVDWFGS